MVNVIPPDHVDDVPVVEPNQHNDVPVVPEPVLVDENEDPKEEEFKEEEEPQEEEDDMEVDIEEDENEPELTYPYEEVDPLNPPPPASESEPEDVTEIENTIEHEDETVYASFLEVGESSTAHFLREESDGLLPGLMMKDINSLFVRMASFSRGLCGREIEHALVEKKGKSKDEYYDKLILELDNEVCASVEQGTAVMEKLVERLGNVEEKAECKKLKKELEEARVRAHEFYQEMIHTGFVFEERLNEAIDVPVKDEERTPKESHGIMPPKSARLTQADIRRMIKEIIDAAIAAERARHANARNDARWFGIVKGQDAAPVVRECTFDGFMKCNPNAFHGTEGAVNNNQRQRNARAMITTPTDGKVSSRSLSLCERCFTRHVGPCTIKFHKCGKVRHKARYCKEKNVATGANALPIPTCDDCGKQGHTRNRCPKKVKQEEVREVRGRAYAIKDAEPQGPNVVTGTFLLNNRYASVLFDLGSDRSFVDSGFSSMLNINLVKIGASYEVKLADERVVSTNIILKGCTLNLVNRVVP
nr:hypothetical protein [Tanacetum cinerariifolium]